MNRDTMALFGVHPPNGLAQVLDEEIDVKTPFTKHETMCGFYQAEVRGMVGRLFFQAESTKPSGCII